MGCLISSILGLFVGFFLFAAGAQADYGEFNQLTFNRFSGIILIAICGIYLLVRFVKKVRKDLQAAEQTPPPVQQERPQQAPSPPPPQSRSSGGVLFVPRPDEQNQPDER